MELFFPNKEGGPSDIAFPGVGYQIHKPFLGDPKMAEPERDRTKILAGREGEGDGLMVRGGGRQDIRGC